MRDLNICRAVKSVKKYWGIIIALFFFGLFLLRSNVLAAIIDPTSSRTDIRNCLPTDYKPGKVTICTSDDAIENALGWVAKPRLNLCGGYYREPLLDFRQIGLLQSNDTSISADSGSLFKVGRSVLQGNVLVKQPDRQMTAQTAHIYRNKAGKVTQIDLFGDVKFREQGRLLVGKTAHFQPNKKTGRVDHALYRLSLSNEQSKQHGNVKLFGTNGWGTAKTIERKKNGDYVLHHATYGTCPPPSQSWRISAKKIYLDKKSGRGYADNVVMRIHDVPVFYWPYYNFPIDDQRKSGFLTPYIGYGTNGGLNLALPYYLNLATNYDLILTPELYSKRGGMLGGTFRYLTKHRHGQMVFSYMPEDKEYKKFKRDNAKTFQAQNRPPGKGNYRGSFSWQDDTQYNENWSTHIDYTNVSDDFYLQDFSNNLAVVTENQLLQKADVNYNNEHWTFLGRVQRYQTLQPLSTLVSNVYSRLPQLVLTGNYPDSVLGGDFQVIGQFDSFQWPGPGELPIGERYHVNPQLSFPTHRAYGFFTPTIGLQATHYSVKNQPLGSNTNLNRALPVLSVDSGLYFDRQLTLQGHDYIQTLEPRVYYLFVPYDNQEQVPNFESGYYIFNYQQLFRDNRFSGTDRIGDANQVSVGLTTRFIDSDTGFEKFRAGIGQIYYFRNRRVNLCPGIGCTDNPVNGIPPLGFLSQTDKVSPLAGMLNYYITQHWSTTASVAWQPKDGRVDNGNLSLNYLPGENHIISLGYSFLRNGDQSGINRNPDRVNNNLDQITVSYAWPLNPRWSTVGAVSYNISHDYPMTYFSGIQYNTCCWAVRAVAARTFSSLNNNRDPRFNNSFYLQVLFKGLGTVGANNPSSMINSYVPGYRDMFK